MRLNLWPLGVLVLGFVVWACAIPGFFWWVRTFGELVR